MAPDIDELVENLQELDPEEWQELSRKIQTDWSQKLRDAQQAYFERLEEENLLGSTGGTFQPIPGQEEEWIEYCREHPNDPICLAGTPPAVGDRLGDFLEIREEYLSHLEEEGLMDIEESSSQRGFGRGTGGMQPMDYVQGNPSPQPSVGGSGSPVGLTPPPDPPYPWPPWPWPWPPGVGPWAGGDPIPFPADPIPAPFAANRGQRPDFTGLQGAARQGQQVSFDPRGSFGGQPSVGGSGSPVGLTPPPDPPYPWPPWPWPWPWQQEGPRPWSQY